MKSLKEIKLDMYEQGVYRSLKGESLLRIFLIYSEELKEATLFLLLYSLLWLLVLY
jgi:hypothetical protein